MSSLTITFKTITSDADIIIELDDERNNGKTEFMFGEKAYFKVFADPSVNVSIRATDGTITNEGTGQDVVEENLQFIDSNEATTSKPILSISSYEWLGNSLGTITKKDVKTLQAEKTPDPLGDNGIGLLNVKYLSSFRRYAISVPQISGKNEYSVLVVAVRE